MPRNPLEPRTAQFGKNVRTFLKQVPKDILFQNDCKQLWRSSASIGANYIEALEAMSKKDFLYRIRIARKEAKESIFWLDMVEANIPPHLKEQHSVLLKECHELAKIFTSIAKTTQERYRLE